LSAVARRAKAEGVIRRTGYITNKVCIVLRSDRRACAIGERGFWRTEIAEVDFAFGSLETDDVASRTKNNY
jgi:hypothetical protein